MRLPRVINLGITLTALLSAHNLAQAKTEPASNLHPQGAPKLSNPAQLKPEKIFIADSKKTQFQIKDGLIVGGDRAINQVVIKDVRFSQQKGFERIVIDLDGTQNGELAAISRPPYYQVEMNPHQKRVGISIWGHPEIRMNQKKVEAIFHQSQLLGGIQILPKVEDEVWTFALPLKSESTIEVFELGQPARIIVDIARKKG